MFRKLTTIMFNKAPNMFNETTKNGLSIASVLKTFSRCFVLIFCIGNLQAEANFQDQRQLLQLVEYIGVDYGAAVQNGQIIDQGEYREMQDFASIIIEKSQANIELQPSLIEQANKLSQSINLKLSLTAIQAITSTLKQQLLVNSPQLSLPKRLISAEQGLQLYQNNCSGCHGETGQGNGLLAKGLTPEPTNFTDKERAMNRSIMGLYDVISGGLDGTAMPAFTQLSDKQRWSLAFQVGSMAFSKSESSANPSISLFGSHSKLILTQLVNYSPNEILDNGSNNNNNSSKNNNSNQKENISRVEIERLRAAPNRLFAEKPDPFEIALEQLFQSEMAYKKNDFSLANSLAVSAYLDGFELVENGLDVHNKPMRKNIETKLLELRQLIHVAGNDTLVKQSIAEISDLLKNAEQIVNGGSMSDTTLFSASFIILLREGLEALLVVLALFTILVKSKKEKAIKYVHYGWILALVLGLLTWFVAQYLVEISGASREIMEGVAAMIAAIILFYVGFWMHNKSQASQWQRYIQDNINKSLTTGTLWGISSLAFIAVYREVFETVLFYQSLMTQAADSQGMVLLAGFGFAALILIVLAWLMVKYSIKLPIGKFFSSTSYLLLLLSFVLIGKAISALQEAAIIAISPMPISYELDWLGVSSTWQSFSAQIIILIMSILLILKSRLKAK